MGKFSVFKKLLSSSIYLIEPNSIFYGPHYDHTSVIVFQTGLADFAHF